MCRISSGDSQRLAVVSHEPLLVAHHAAERVEPPLDDRVFQRFDERLDALRQLFGWRHADHAALHAPPVIDRRGAAVRAFVLPVSQKQLGKQFFIERAPVPERRGKRLRRAVVLNADQPVGRLRRFRREPLPVADDVDAVLQKRRKWVAFRAGPAKLHHRPRVHEPCAERKRVDAGGHAEDRRGRDIADPVAVRACARNDAREELGLIDTAVIGAHAGVGHGDRTVQDLHIRVRGCGAAACVDERRRRGKDHLRAVLDRLHKERVRRMFGVGDIRLRRDPARERFLGKQPPLLVSADPVRGLGRVFVKERRRKVRRQEHCVIDARKQGLPAGLGFGCNGHVRFGVGHARVERGEQRLGGELVEIVDRVDRRPCKERVGRTDALRKLHAL